MSSHRPQTTKPNTVRTTFDRLCALTPDLIYEVSSRFTLARGRSERRDYEEKARKLAEKLALDPEELRKETAMGKVIKADAISKLSDLIKNRREDAIDVAKEIYSLLAVTGKGLADLSRKLIIIKNKSLGQNKEGLLHTLPDISEAQLKVDELPHLNKGKNPDSCTDSVSIKTTDDYILQAAESGETILGSMTDPDGLNVNVRDLGDGISLSEFSMVNNEGDRVSDSIIVEQDHNKKATIDLIERGNTESQIEAIPVTFS